MTKRLEDALNKLRPADLETLTQLAERLANSSEADTSPRFLKLDWIGCMQGAPERDGVEAARRANEIRMELLRKNAGIDVNV